MKKELKELNVLGTVYKTIIPEHVASKNRWELPDMTKVKAVIPGTVLEILVHEGQEIANKQNLLSLDAMKMANLIKATKRGIVKKIHVKAGDRVTKDQLLVEIE
jgi:biotin carboxyl carrier protein